MRGIVIQPATDHPVEVRFVWICEDCMRISETWRSARFALADSEDHECPADPLVNGALDLFGGTT